MSADTLWLDLVRKRPALANEAVTVEITAANLRKLTAQFYRAGHRDGVAAQEVKESFQSLFDRIFGK
jgi:hypothetical protein